VRTYLVFEPAGGSRNAASADRVRFVRDKFYWSALFVTPFWLIWHRLWLGFCAWLVACAVIGGGAYQLDLNPAVTAVALLVPSLVVAFEGAELRRRKELRAGFRDAGISIGEDLEDAERRFFADWPSEANERKPKTNPARPLAPQQIQPTATNGVIGLFPEPGGGR
jgi:hypothetical protein